MEGFGSLKKMMTPLWQQRRQAIRGSAGNGHGCRLNKMGGIPVHTFQDGFLLNGRLLEVSIFALRLVVFGGESIGCLV